MQDTLQQKEETLQKMLIEIAQVGGDTAKYVCNDFHGQTI